MPPDAYCENCGTKCLYVSIEHKHLCDACEVISHKPVFSVARNERHKHTFLVHATDAEDARQALAENDCGPHIKEDLGCRYYYTLNSDNWTVNKQ